MVENPTRLCITAGLVDGMALHQGVQKNVVFMRAFRREYYVLLGCRSFSAYFCDIIV